ncbi:unnamed protein product [Darwinula stevensoni]|uniref:Potassium channel domain-containing protein n=1 Tax=Darwinula stevensoni TaxID=69355 RepID=A0A7R8XDY0_9CRUS|nr:unnamed protein product [Darwinula stevensoni]CAG0894769.1 unnamed protein product [Darwinula stevensoni]
MSPRGSFAKFISFICKCCRGQKEEEEEGASRRGDLTTTKYDGGGGRRSLGEEDGPCLMNRETFSPPSQFCGVFRNRSLTSVDRLDLQKMEPGEQKENDASLWLGKNDSPTGSREGSDSAGRKERSDSGISESETDASQDRNSKCRLLLKSTLTCVFSHAGLYALVAGYTVLGAFIFRALETEYEVVVRERGTRLRSHALTSMWNTTCRLNVLWETNWTAEMSVHLRRFEDAILRAASRDGYDGLDPDSDDRKWSLPGALLFSVTVITTIGYGNISPHTERGRVVTMVYAAFGIPLVLLCLSNVGGTLADALVFAYGKLECRRSVSPAPVDELRLTVVEAEANERRLTVADVAGGEAPRKFPASLVLIILVAYVCGGALLFSLWEGWNFLEGAYFCFITLSTIGFGDLVPGRAVFHVDTMEEQAKVVICCFYLLFGLALIAMGFSLVQAEVVAKVRDCGAFLGIIGAEKQERRSTKK